MGDITDRHYSEESIFININETDKLHLKRIFTNPDGPPVLLVHGSIENGKIFYSSSGKGLAPYLALCGFDVFVADLRGRGLSTPAIGRGSDHGLSNIISEDIPAFYNKIKEIKGSIPQHWIAHSWGGVVYLAYLAKNPDHVNVASLVLFGSKRRIGIVSPERIYLIELLWNLLASLYIKYYGYLPAVKINIGADNETARSHEETNIWVYSKKWTDWYDEFDYSAALKKIKLPPILVLTGKNDKVLGHPADVQRLLDEIGDQDYQFKILSRKNGNLHDYGHVDILTHADAAKDHFPEVVNWMKSIENSL